MIVIYNNGRFSRAVGGGGGGGHGRIQRVVASGTLAAWEAVPYAPHADCTVDTADTTALTADIVNAGDVAAFAGTVAYAAITGTLAATEAADVAAFTGAVTISGALAAIEAPDTVALAGTVATLGNLAATEAADT